MKSLLELIEAIDGPLTANLPASGGLSSDSVAKLRRAESVTTQARRELESIKLAHLMPRPDMSGYSS